MELQTATAVETLAEFIRTNGPIKTCRISSAQARGAAKKYAYWGAVRYEIRVNKNGDVFNFPLERASSDRRSVAGAERDADEICNREKRVALQTIGRLSENDARDMLDILAALNY